MDHQIPSVGLVTTNGEAWRTTLIEKLVGQALNVRVFDTVEEYLALDGTDVPTTLVADVTALSDKLKARIESADPLELRFVILSSLSERTAAGMVASLKGVSLVAGGPRFQKRALEAIVGSRSRRKSERVSVPLSAWVDADGRTDSVAVEDISATGAMVFGAREMEPGQRLTLILELSGGVQLRVRSAVVRTSSTDDSMWHTGVRYLALSAVDAASLERFLAQHGQKGETPKAFSEAKAAPRLRLPRKLAVKARIEAEPSGRRDYLSVIDISESGFLGASKHQLDLTVGARYRLVLLWAATGLDGACELVRRETSTGRHPHLYGFRFVAHTTGSKPVSYLAQLAREMGLRSTGR